MGMSGTWVEKHLNFGNGMTKEIKDYGFSISSKINQSESESILKGTA
jgi:hypothetical protein